MGWFRPSWHKPAPAPRPLVRPLVLPLEPRALLHGGLGTPEPLDALPTGALPPPVGPSAQVMGLGSIPQLSSFSQASVKLYLQFGGASPRTWGGFDASAPAYDTDEDSTTFTPREHGQIREIWSRLAEKFSPFNVDVTTVDPGNNAYLKVARVVIGGDGAWAGGTYGGYAYVGGFRGYVSNTGWVFSKNLGKGLPKYVAEAAGHEAGHLFGLYHQSAYDGRGVKTDEYRGGRDRAAPDATGPVMGYSYYATRGVWATGTSSNGATSIQSDMDVVAQAANGFGYRPDDHGDARDTAGILNVVDGLHASGDGVIERTSDVDYFRFRSDGGLVQLTADVAEFGAMLDLTLALTDADGAVLAAADTASLGESVSALVPAGDYFLAVASHGEYGDVGQYSIGGTVVPEPATVALLAVAWALQGRGQRTEGVWRSKGESRVDKNVCPAEG